MCDGVVLVTDAVPLDGHRVAVRFSDGYSGVLDMAKYFGYPAFAGLNDPAVFATARAGLGTGGGRAVGRVGRVDESRLLLAAGILFIRTCLAGFPV